MLRTFKKLSKVMCDIFSMTKRYKLETIYCYFFESQTNCPIGLLVSRGKLLRKKDFK